MQAPAFIFRPCASQQDPFFALQSPAMQSESVLIASGQILTAGMTWRHELGFLIVWTPTEFPLRCWRNRLQAGRTGCNMCQPLVLSTAGIGSRRRHLLLGRFRLSVAPARCSKMSLRAMHGPFLNPGSDPALNPKRFRVKQQRFTNPSLTKGLLQSRISRPAASCSGAPAAPAYRHTGFLLRGSVLDTIIGVYGKYKGFLKMVT